MNPLKHPAAHQIPENDVEKRGDVKESSVNSTLSGSDPTDSTLENSQNSSNLAASDIAPTTVLLTGRLARWNAKIEGLAGLGTYIGVHIHFVGLGLEFRGNLRWSSFLDMFKARQTRPAKQY